MSRVLHREGSREYPTAIRGDGCYLVDANGRRYLDASGGAAVSCLGHGHAGVVAAVRTQLESLPYAHTSFFTNAPMEALAEALVRDAPGRLEKVFFCSSGSEAVEAALKLARQYFVEIGQPQRSVFIARRQSYHGNTLGALAAGGNAWRRRMYAPLLTEVSHVSPCYRYRGLIPGEGEVDYAARLVGELEAEIVRLGPERVIGFVAEPVVGATLGAVPAVGAYFQGVRDVCNRHGILLILDEVMCGMGRTGTLYAFEQEQVRPDIVVVGKGLGAGYQPIAAVIAGRLVVEAIESGSGAFQHSHTFTGHAAACAAGVAVLDAIERDGLLARVAAMGRALEHQLENRFGDHPHVGDIRGRGLLQALELVRDRETKAPFDPERKVYARLRQAAMDAGLICYPSGGTIDGRLGDHVLLAPPYIIGEAELEELVEKLGRALDSTLCST